MSITKKDNFGRDVYIKVNDSERYIIKYYVKTNKKKIIIKLINEEKIIALFGRNGRTIFSSNTSEFFDLGAIHVYKSEIKIILPEKIRNDYLLILRNLKKKKKENEPRPRRRNTRTS